MLVYFILDMVMLSHLHGIYIVESHHKFFPCMCGYVNVMTCYKFRLLTQNCNKGFLYTHTL